MCGNIVLYSSSMCVGAQRACLITLANLHQDCYKKNTNSLNNVNATTKPGLWGSLSPTATKQRAHKNAAHRRRRCRAASAQGCCIQAFPLSATAGPIALAEVLYLHYAPLNTRKIPRKKIRGAENASFGRAAASR